MSKIFKVETESLDAIVCCLRKASDEVNSCVTTLKSVTSHNDWTCKEREQINQVLEDVKHKSNSFAREYEEYAVRVKQDSDIYNDLVKEEIKSGMVVDSKISELLSIVSGTYVGNSYQVVAIESSVQNIIKKITDKQLENWIEQPRYIRSVFNNIDRPISTVDYHMFYKELGDE